MNKKLKIIIALFCAFMIVLSCGIAVFYPSNNSASAAELPAQKAVNQQTHNHSADKLDTVFIDTAFGGTQSSYEVLGGSATNTTPSVSGSVSNTISSTESIGSPTNTTPSVSVSVSNSTSSTESIGSSTNTSSSSESIGSPTNNPTGSDSLLPRSTYYKDFLNAGFVPYWMKTIVIGDLTGDGKVNNRDLGMMQKVLNGWDVYVDTDAADVTRDGKVNNRDLGRLQKYLNGHAVDWTETTLSFEASACDCSKSPIGYTKEGAIAIYVDDRWEIFQWDEYGAKKNGSINFEVFTHTDGIRHASWTCPINNSYKHAVEIPEECKACAHTYGDFFYWEMYDDEGAYVQCRIKLNNWWYGFALNTGMIRNEVVPNISVGSTHDIPTEWTYGEEKLPIYLDTFGTKKYTVSFEDTRFIVSYACKHTGEIHTTTIDIEDVIQTERSIVAEFNNGFQNVGAITTTRDCLFHTFNANEPQTLECEICGLYLVIEEDGTLYYSARYEPYKNGGIIHSQGSTNPDFKVDGCSGCYTVTGDYDEGKILYKDGTSGAKWTSAPTHSMSIYVENIDGDTRVVMIPCKECEGCYHFEKIEK